MSSSAASSSLSRILIGSLIGAVIGLILLALGVAILWNAVDQRMAKSASSPTSSSTPPTPPKPLKPTSEAAASPVPYPQVSPGKAAAPAAVEPEAPSRAATSVWRSIFDDEEERGAAPTAAPGPAARPGPTRPAAPRASTPRRPPEAQRQDDSLFF